jgi:uncharacterized protein
MLILPETARSLYVLAHGAGAGMHHHFMESMAQSLARQQVGTLRYNFPYMEAGGKRPDPPAVLHARVRDAIDRGVEAAHGLPVIAGGKSMGGRMTSQALARQHDPRVKGIAFLGFPLHQPGKPSVERAAHLADVQVPMLFLQGTRDTLAQIDWMREMVAGLGARATLHVVDTADHSFAVLKRAGKSKEDVHNELAEIIAEWTLAL